MAKKPTSVPSPAHNSQAGDWRAALLDEIRSLMQVADPAIQEDRKWRKPSNPDGVPTWMRNGIICTGETYRDKVKLTFTRGAALDDPTGLFNASLDGNARRAIDMGSGYVIDEKAFVALVRAAVAANAGK